LDISPQQTGQALVLHGVDLELQSLTLNEQLLTAQAYQVQGEELIISQVPNERFTFTNGC
jgi:aminopeptidase N